MDYWIDDRVSLQPGAHGFPVVFFCPKGTGAMCLNPVGDFLEQTIPQPHFYHSQSWVVNMALVYHFGP